MSKRNACNHVKLVVNACLYFPALDNCACSFLLSRAWHRLHVFRTWQRIACFPAFGSGCIFSRFWQRVHFSRVWQRVHFSRAWQRGHVFPRLMIAVCMSMLTWREEYPRRRIILAPYVFSVQFTCKQLYLTLALGSS